MSAARKALEALAKADAEGCDTSICGSINGPCDRCERLERLSINLSAPLAAVVRAAMERPWWRQWSDVDGETGAFIAENMECHVCGFERRDTDPVRHADSCEMADIDAALDAFNDAAAAQGFGKETT